MNREQVYQRIYQNLNEFKTTKSVPKRDVVGDWLSAAETASAVGAVGGLGAAATGVGVLPGALAMGASSLIDAGTAIGRAMRGEWDLAALNALGAVPVFGDVSQAARLAKTGVEAVSTAKDVSKAADAATAFKTVETPMVTPRTRPGAPTKPRTVPETPTKPTSKPTAKPDVSTIPKSPGIATTAKTTSGLGKLASATGKVLKHPGTQIGIPAAYVASQYIGSDKDVDTDTALPLIPGDSDRSGLMYQPSIGDAQLHQLGAFTHLDPSAYGKSVLPSRFQSQDHTGYHPFFTMPSDVVMQYRRRNTNLPESVNHNTRDVMYKKAYSAVNRYLRSTEGRQLNDHISKIKKGVAE